MAVTVRGQGDVGETGRRNLRKAWWWYGLVTALSVGGALLMMLLFDRDAYGWMLLGMWAVVTVVMVVFTIRHPEGRTDPDAHLRHVKIPLDRYDYVYFGVVVLWAVAVTANWRTDIVPGYWKVAVYFLLAIPMLYYSYRRDRRRRDRKAAAAKVDQSPSRND